MAKIAKKYSTLNKHSNLIVLGGLTTFINVFIWASALFIAKDITLPNYMIVFSLVQPLTVGLAYLSSYGILENFNEKSKFTYLRYGLCFLPVVLYGR